MQETKEKEVIEMLRKMKESDIVIIENLIKKMIKKPDVL